ncbi:MAG: hypothetical protein AABX84_02910 [Nanoarchaeota archaeon]
MNAICPMDEMIGYFNPTRIQKKSIKEVLKNCESDENFIADKEFLLNYPKYKNKICCSEMVFFHEKNVLPHTDATENEEIDKLNTLFWLIQGTLYLQVGESFVKMKSGNFVAFNDGILHSVLADRKWVGTAWSITTKGA